MIHWENYSDEDRDLAIDIVNAAKDHAVPFTQAVLNVLDVIEKLRREPITEPSP
jgi:hypothetical protein